MKWVYACMFILWAIVMIGAIKDKAETMSADGVTIVKMGAQP